MPNHIAPTPTSNGYNDLYSSDSDDDSVFEEMVDSKILNPINAYIVLPQPLKLGITPHKVFKKQLKIRGGKRLATIKRANYNKIASACFLLNALHSMS